MTLAVRRHNSTVTVEHKFTGLVLEHPLVLLPIHLIQQISSSTFEMYRTRGSPRTMVGNVCRRGFRTFAAFFELS